MYKTTQTRDSFATILNYKSSYLNQFRVDFLKYLLTTDVKSQFPLKYATKIRQNGGGKSVKSSKYSGKWKQMRGMSS